MNIGIITPQYPPNTRGGGEISVQLLAEQLSIRSEHSVHVHTFDGKSSETINGIPVTRHRNTPRIPEIASTIAFFELRDVVSDLDVLHGYNMELHPAVGALSNRYNIPAVAHLNSYTYVDKRSIGMTVSGKERLYNDIVRPLSKVGVRRAIGGINWLIALSEPIGKVYADYLRTDRAITNVTNMIDPDVTPEHADLRISDPPRILYVGSLNSHKGVEYLLKAVNHLNQPIDFRVVGDGEQLNHLQALADNLDSESRIVFSGHVPHEQITNQYRWADVFVHPGTWPEPLNRTLLEAMQHGLAVVVTDRGGPSEIIQDNELVVDPKDPAALADGIEYAIENRRNTGQSLRSYVREAHHPRNVIPQIDALYQNIS